MQRAGKETATNNEVPTKGESSDRSGGAFSVPALSLPKGGGAIRGMGEKFAANPVTGTGSLSVPIFASTGRSGFGPQLSLSYDSGSGNGPFGFGWSLSLPSITRKTDKGLPKYQDANESDVFILSGAEDLVSVLKKDTSGKMVFDEKERGDYMVRRYKPRIEGLFALIERWTNKTNGQIHWRSISKDNILTIYGRDAESRIYDPDDKSKIFSWLICESYDDKGNTILYKYEAENDKGVDTSQANECNRLRTANRYLKRILYGNLQPLLLDIGRPSFRKPHTEQTDLSSVKWMFELVFDYDEGHYKTLPPDNTKPKSGQHQFVEASATASGTWPTRPDPFSTYRAGFEIRTYRRCKRVLMFHNFKELGTKPCLVRSTEFDYSDLDDSEPVDIETELKHKGSTRFASFIRKITQSGYVQVEQNSNKYITKSLPPLEFEYSQAVIQEKITQIDNKSLENLPIGLDGASYQWVDLDGEGVFGILTEQAEAWFYKRNLGDGKFSPLEIVKSKPSLADLSSGLQQLLDLAGDGQLDVVQLDGSVPGFYERTNDQQWKNFRQFSSLPNISWKDSNLKFIDLTGDGHADVIITEDDVFTWYPSLAEDGFGPAEKVPKSFDEEKGPRLVFKDGTESIYLADLSGDGLTDFVRIRNGEVCYWPNLGYGHFGSKVTMDNAPWFDTPDQFDHKRIRLADIDGSGATDIIYLGSDGVRIYFNHSGNSWSDARKLPIFPQINNLVSIQVADLLGNGTACLVWSSPLPGNSGQPMQYVDLMGGQKPHLLMNSKNNLGAETRVEYAASTKFYLADKAAGKPWITRLPFPVHVVERVETYDRISRNRFVTRYAYHHGYFDGIEREFRGFGMVEQWDTEEIGTVDPEESGKQDTNWDKASFVPLVLTRTWFHTGAYSEEGSISKQFETEYYREGDPSLGEGELEDKQLQAMLLPDTILSDDLTAEEAREACRSLKGSILRQEVFALDCRPDGSLSEESDRPYTVSERNYTIKCLQYREQNKHAVFFAHPRETVDFHYERKLYDICGHKRADPRVTHSMNLDVDDYGNVLQSVAIGYGRRYDKTSELLTDKDEKKQTKTLVTYTENVYTNYIDMEDAYRTPLPYETRTYELLKLSPAAKEPLVTNLFRFNEMLGKIKDVSDGQHEIPYEDIDAVGAQEEVPYRRLIEHMRTYYRKNNLTGGLPPKELESLALPYESFKLAFTPDLVTKVYGNRVTNTMLSNEGMYVYSEGDLNWWIPSGRVFYSPEESNTSDEERTFASEHFFLPHRFCDPFGNSTIVLYDSNEIDHAKNYNVLLKETRDALGNKVTAENDYRVLQPKLMTDPNGNRSVAAFDTLGLVVGTAVMGKITEPDGKPKGDILDGFEADITLSQIQAFVANPRDTAPGLLKGATSRIIYDVDRVLRCGQPMFAATLTREMHQSDPGGDTSPIQIGVTYSDGFGREIQTKIQAEKGNAPERGPDAISPGGDIKPGELVLENGKPKQKHTDHRWVGKGRTVYNNKGKPVKQYEPFFSSTHLFEEEPEMTDTGVTPVLFYDPLERVVATLHPNHTYDKVVFDAWYQETYDVNDTVTCDPRTDPDISGYVLKYFQQEVPGSNDWKTWLQQRNVDPLDPPQDATGLDPEKKVAIRTIIHADTPAYAYLDSLGRTFLTVAHNRFKRSDKPASEPPIEEFYGTHVLLDIEGNQREVIDAKDRVVMSYDYDMLGNRIHQSSMEAGERWMLNDVTGKPIYAWDSRDHQFRTAYDQLRRPTESYMGEGAGQELLIGRTVYGETQTTPEMKNLRGKVYQVFDQAGVVTSEEYDFKGNLRRSNRQLAKDYKDTLNWSATSELEAEIFISSTTYDALNRPIQIIAPHSSKAGAKFNVIQPVYNEANLLDSEEVWLECEEVWLEQNVKPNGLLDPTTATMHAVKNIDYNAKGQREHINYGNGAETRYTYDPETFRLIHLYTRRGVEFNEDCGGNPSLFPSPEEPPKDKTCGLQNLHYTYDPAGNIITIRDDAQQTIFFDKEVVKPENEYTYDAIYRLIVAHGREHFGQATVPHTTWNDIGRVKLEHPQDGTKMRNYFEYYEYDEVGNIQKIDHKDHDINWTRSYEYKEESQIEPGKNNNRLSRTVVHPNGQQPINEPYTYDVHGNMTNMPHLPQMQWDFKDELHMVDKGNDCKAYYVYDATDQRVRKVIEQNGTPKKERIYIGGFEVYREYNSNGAVKLERETLHIMDDKQRIALVETRTLDTAGDDKAPRQLIRYQFGNHLGSASLELDDKAQIISYEEYYPYGSTSYQAVDKTIKAAAKRYRYTGKERDDETGLYYHGARYYAGWLGRWTASDPLGIADGSNSFSYVNCAPTTLRDPTGTNGDDPLKNASIKGKVGYWQGKEGRLNIAEPMTVGETGIPESVARARALDVNNRELLGMITNQKVQGSGVPMRPLSPARPPISVSEDPSAMITRRFSEITEMRAIFDEAVASIQNPSKMKPTALKKAINENIWEIVRTGQSPEAGRVRAALGALGAEDIPGKGYRLRMPRVAGATLNAAGGALFLLEAARMARDQRMAEQGYAGRAGRAVLQDDGGEYVLDIRWGRIFNDYYKSYISGPMAGTTKELGFFEMRREIKKVDKKYGYFDCRGDLVPGRVPPVVIYTNPDII